MLASTPLRHRCSGQRPKHLCARDAARGRWPERRRWSFCRGRHHDWEIFTSRAVLVEIDEPTHLYGDLTVAVRRMSGFESSHDPILFQGRARLREAARCGLRASELAK